MTKVGEDKRRSEFNSKYTDTEKRELLQGKTFPAKLKQILLETKTSPKSETTTVQLQDTDDKELVVDIVLSCAKEDWKYASFFKEALKDTAPGLIVRGIHQGKTEKERLKLMDTARCVVAFLSPNYLDSPEQVEEFHVALCRQRVSSTTVLFPVTIHMLPKRPTYFHLVPCAVNITDSLWVELVHRWKVTVPLFDLAGMRERKGQGITAEVALGLMEAVCVLSDALEAKNNR